VGDLLIFAGAAVVQAIFGVTRAQFDPQAIPGAGSYTKMH